ncbi:alkaline phosphatase [Sporosarcina sp. Marseille-Q4063]|uniref:alkaline phosphatase n=1 Tax=Sporosarcina sp. Marseille-Q4063 TaxID=2810514 RepID=UPI001BB06DC2|nr:alkaline phosphatase [Sporosarcina sp. Marseille-Q4063]QUW22942.1 alkaline phosphatase [Sporosarcina sp. Marseille-Q4063]
MELKKTLQKKSLIFAIAGSLIVGSFAGNASLQTAGAENPQSNEKVENVIFMIPDGYSSAYATNYRLYKGEESIMDPHLVGMHRTYSANSEVTDSAAAGTAMATGTKTNNGVISMDPDGNKLETILQTAEKSGKSSGLVATSTITHATPAVFASHVESRANEDDIAPQLLQNDVDVILGGGKKYFSDDLLNEAKQDGYEIVSDAQSLNNIDKTNKLIGLFAEDSLSPELDRETTDEPSLKEMTSAAIDVLSNDKDGFFLMVEGSQIDWAGHANDAAWVMKDAEAFEEAVEAALDFAKKDKKTLVVIAGDHDTGGMSVGGYDGFGANLEILKYVTATGDFMASQINEEQSNIQEVIFHYTGISLTEAKINRIKQANEPAFEINSIISEQALVGWTHTGHTGTDVPVYAYGPQAHKFAGLIENTDFPQLMAEAMKIPFK